MAVTGPVVGAGRSCAGGIGDPGDVDAAGGDCSDRVDERVRHEEVVDEFAAAPVDAGIPLPLGDQRGQIPESVSVALVSPVKASRADF